MGETAAMARIHFIGGEKGGVGKSLVARLLAQYHIDRELPFTVFDGDRSHAAMLRFYRDYADPVDVGRFESLDRIVEPALEEDRNVIVDLAAQSSRSLERWMADSGLVEIGGQADIAITLWHLMDDGTDSLRLLEHLLDTHGKGPDYVVVRNFGRGEDFSLLEQSETKTKATELNAHFMDLPALHAPTMRRVDRSGASFWAAVNNRDPAAGPRLGLLERQRVKVWLGRVYQAFDTLYGQFPVVPIRGDETS
jgi:hypothetical protein